MNSPDPFLIVIDPERYGGFYDCILEWVSKDLPFFRHMFVVRSLPHIIREGERHCLMVPWVQDPIEHATPNVFEQLRVLQAQCDNLGIPHLNELEGIGRVGKSRALSIIGQTGLRVPGAWRFVDTEDFLRRADKLPLSVFVREEFGHGGEMLRADLPEESRLIPLRKFENLTAIELIDMPNPTDGLYRKYRYIVAGNLGLPQHLQISKEWITRGRNRVINDSTRAEEMAYIEAPCPPHKAFLKAARALGLDYLAFDYSIDYNGNPVVWEANPYPDIRYAKDHRLNYRNDAVTRTHAVIVAMYFLKAGLAMPDKLRSFLEQSPSVQGL